MWYAIVATVIVALALLRILTSAGDDKPSGV